MIKSHQMQDAVDEQLGYSFQKGGVCIIRLFLGCFTRNDNITQQPWGDMGKFTFLHGKCQNICGFVNSPVSLVELLNLIVVRNYQGYFMGITTQGV